MIERKKEIRITFLIIITLLVAWGLFHVIGGYFGGIGEKLRYTESYKRALAIAGAFAIFLGGWYLVFRARFGKKD